MPEKLLSEEERLNRAELQVHTCDLVLYMPLEKLNIEKREFANKPISIQEIVDDIDGGLARDSNFLSEAEKHEFATLKACISEEKGYPELGKIKVSNISCYMNKKMLRAQGLSDREITHMTGKDYQLNAVFQYEGSEAQGFKQGYRIGFRGTTARDWHDHANNYALWTGRCEHGNRAFEAVSSMTVPTMQYLELLHDAPGVDPEFQREFRNYRVEVLGQSRGGLMAEMAVCIYPEWIPRAYVIDAPQTSPEFVEDVVYQDGMAAFQSYRDKIVLIRGSNDPVSALGYNPRYGYIAGECVVRQCADYNMLEALLDPFHDHYPDAFLVEGPDGKMRVAPIAAEPDGPVHVLVRKISERIMLELSQEERELVIQALMLLAQEFMGGGKRGADDVKTAAENAKIIEEGMTLFFRITEEVILEEGLFDGCKEELERDLDSLRSRLQKENPMFAECLDYAVQRAFQASQTRLRLSLAKADKEAGWDNAMRELSAFFALKRSILGSGMLLSASVFDYFVLEKHSLKELLEIKLGQYKKLAENFRKRLRMNRFGAIVTNGIEDGLQRDLDELNANLAGALTTAYTLHGLQSKYFKKKKDGKDAKSAETMPDGIGLRDALEIWALAVLRKGAKGKPGETKKLDELQSFCRKNAAACGQMAGLTCGMLAEDLEALKAHPVLQALKEQNEVGAHDIEGKIAAAEESNARLGEVFGNLADSMELKLPPLGSPMPRRLSLEAFPAMPRDPLAVRSGRLSIDLEKSNEVIGLLDSYIARAEQREAALRELWAKLRGIRFGFGVCSNLEDMMAVTDKRREQFAKHRDHIAEFRQHCADWDSAASAAMQAEILKRKRL